jgi:polysaccharide deacetylase family protein (PEP-CTERM system associated)
MSPNRRQPLAPIRDMSRWHVDCVVGGGEDRTRDKGDCTDANLVSGMNNQVAPMRQIIPHRYWPRFDLRIEKSTMTTLDMLDRHGATATFFTIGWLAERCPDLLKEIVRRGHDVASKGYFHQRFDQMSIDEFRDDFLRSRDAIEAATGIAVAGYRIAEGALPVDDKRPFEILAREGVRYDSSVRPFGPGFIGRRAQRDIHQVSGNDWSLTEVPLSSDTFAGVPIPVTGGNYMRQMPRALYESRLERYMAHRDQPWHLYFHVWELDPEQPRVSATTRFGRIRQYRNLEAMRERIEHSLDRFAFHSVSDHLGIAPQPAVVREIVAAPVEIRTVDLTGPRQKVTIVTPCYNEEETLPYLAGNLASVEKASEGVYEFSYVFVDDGSKDGTWDKLHELFGGRDDVQLIRHVQNRGIAAATMTGIRAARDEIVCGIDCDCSFDPHELARMIPLLTPDIDMVQASPYHREGGVTNVPAWRLALSKGVCSVYRHILNHAFSSYTACFRVYRRSKMVNMKLDDEGFMGIMEIFVRLDQSGARIVEFPAVLESRLLGTSKMKVLRVIRNHLGLIVRIMRDKRGQSSFAADASPNPSQGAPYGRV